MNPMSNNQQTDHLDSVRAEIEKIFAKMDKGMRLPVELVKADGDYCDPLLRVANGMAEVYVNVNEDHPELPRFSIGITHLIRGVHMRWDGSGEPDEYDYEEKSSENVAWRAAVAALKLAYANEIDAAAEAVGEDQLAEQLKKAEELADREMEKG
jgi:hypothetical protein